ncbi:MAG: prolipoprotein diacylglyceryl transferase [Oscillospiraceae bacterium]|jgi:phosphatidylglycerol:prolipoprotein diacylglycerol transferase
MNTVSFPGIGFAVNVKPIAFHIFGWPIHWYGIIIALGFLLAVFYCSRKAADYGIIPDDVIDLLIWAVPLCIIGARLYYVIFYLDLYRRADGSLDFPAMIRIWDGGLAIYGGILMAILVLLVFCKVKKISFLAFADLGSLGMLIGQLVGRWGNFVNVEAYGGPTDLPWRMGIYDLVNGTYQYMEVHPTFLYESLWNLLGFLLLAFVVARRRKFDGQIFLSYMAWYGLGRAWIEGLRTDSLYFFSTGLRVSQVLAIAFFLAAAAVLAVQLRRKHSPEDLWVNRQKAARTAALEASDPAAGTGEADGGGKAEENKTKGEDSDDPA